MRMIDEYIELKRKIWKLEDKLANRRDGLDKIDIEMMERQLIAMQEYAEILYTRIKKGIEKCED